MKQPIEVIRNIIKKTLPMVLLPTLYFFHFFNSRKYVSPKGIAYRFAMYSPIAKNMKGIEKLNNTPEEKIGIASKYFIFPIFLTDNRVNPAENIKKLIIE